MLAYLIASGDLEGKRIAVQLHGEPLPDMVQTLRLAGAEVIEVPVYRWVLPEDPVPLRRLIQSVGVAGLDAVAFTSAPAATSFLRAADEQGCGSVVRAALRGPVVAACVGPVTAGPFQRDGIPVIQPARSRLGAWPGRSSSRFRAAADGGAGGGPTVELRGHAAVVDGRLVPLSSASMALLRELSDKPGHVVSRPPC